MDDFGFGIDFEPTAPAKAVEVEEDEQAPVEARRSVQMLKTMDVQKRMRLLSESALDGVLPWHFEEGAAYHVISAGDVDSLTYLRHVVRQQRCEYVILSTWCMAVADAREMLEWARRGFVRRFDFYVGEIFKDGYRGCRDVLDEICAIGGGQNGEVPQPQQADGRVRRAVRLCDREQRERGHKPAHGADVHHGQHRAVRLLSRVFRRHKRLRSGLPRLATVGRSIT